MAELGGNPAALYCMAEEAGPACSRHREQRASPAAACGINSTVRSAALPIARFDLILSAG
jgi:hypothetical protein